MSATIKDIAKLANVSIATVSRVINNKDDGISLKTREEILRIAQELNYRPNLLARGLVTKRSNTLGLILPDITNPFFPQVVRGVEDTAHEHGYNVILCNTDDDPAKEQLYIEVLREKCVDGIIFTSSVKTGSKNIRQLMDYKTPFVLLDRCSDIIGLPTVFTDGVLGMYKSVRYLIQMGHVDIAYISGPMTSNSGRERYRGYVKALKESGISLNKSHICEGDYKISEGERCMKELINIRDSFTAVACANDLMAIGAIEMIKQKGKRIPQDISVTGYDDITMAKIVEPKLTTVVQPSYIMGQRSAEMLVKLIEGKKTLEKVVLEPELKIRESVWERV